MNTRIYLIIFLFCFCKFSSGQILCIYCYDQNDSISNGVNNLLFNGGFENSNCVPNAWFSYSYCPNSSYYSCDITNWTCTGGGPSTYADIVDINYAQVAEGTRACYFGNSQCKACSTTPNDTSCIVDTSCAITGIPFGYPLSGSSYGGPIGLSLEQTAIGLVVGNIYVLEFWAGGEDNQVTSGLFAVNIGFGDTLLRCNPTTSVTGIGIRYIIEFIATSTTHTIKFTNWGHICNLCTELILDDVRLYTLAELSPSVPSCSVGINDALISQIIIYPNPITDILNIRVSSNELSEFIFYDIASRKLLQQTFTNSVSINTAQLAKGIYFYELRNKNGVIKKGKVVKN